MVYCACGQIIADKNALCPQCEALHVLGFVTEATEADIRGTYRVLARAWQPGNFEDDSKLKEAAESKLKDINTAFDYLTLTSTERGGSKRPVYLNSKAGAAVQAPNPPADTPAFSASAAAAAIRDANAPRGVWQKIRSGYRKARFIFRVASLLILLITGGSIWTLSRSHAQVDARANRSFQAWQKNLVESVAKQWQRLNALISPPEPAEPAAEPAPKEKVKPQKTHAAAEPAQPETIKLKPYVTKGSTRDEVIDQQGTPTAASEDKLVYGKSEIYLKNDVVVGWRIDPDDPPIRVKLWPQKYVDPELAYFSVGSSKDVVIKVQGTPTAFSEDKFEYGNSVVYFRNNRVVNWKNDPGSIPLQTR